jgi:hypothetical protein
MHACTIPIKTPPPSHNNAVNNNDGDGVTDKDVNDDNHDGATDDEVDNDDGNGATDDNIDSNCDGATDNKVDDKVDNDGVAIVWTREVAAH